jgi:hydroxypyruvate isomerase
VKLSVCIEMVMGDPVFEDRIAKVAEAGLGYFEFWGWEGKNIEAIRQRAAAAGVSPSVFCVKGASLVDESLRGQFVQGFEETLPVARALGVTTLIATTGNERTDVGRAAQHANVVAALRLAAPLAEAAGVTIVLEPLNVLVDHEGYFLSSSDEGFDIVDEVGSPSVKLLFDIYHQQITEGHVIRRLTANIAKIGHFHVADNPGRHEPGTGELNYARIFEAIEATGYDRFVGLEYSPTASAVETLRAVAQLVPRA